MRNEDAKWKEELFTYISSLNEAVLHGDISKLHYTPSKDQLKQLKLRLYNTSQRNRALAMQPVRSEIRARIVKSRVHRGEVEADVAIHLVRHMEQGSRPWVEERVDQERIRLGHAGKSWRILDVKRLTMEKQLTEMTDIEYAQEELEGLGKSSLPSLPYINPHVRYGSKSRVYTGGSSDHPSYYGRGVRGIPYRREAAVAYAERWWNEPNPSYENFEVNCTNYVSQCLFAGGAPMNYTGRRESGWWYKGYANQQEMWSFSWAVANSLHSLLSRQRTYGLRADPVALPESLQLGDVICYDWDGNGRVGHNTIVTGFTPEGMPLVNANTVSSRHRYWDYKDSYAWTEQTRYYFYHITDEF